METLQPGCGARPRAEGAAQAAWGSHTQPWEVSDNHMCAPGMPQPMQSLLLGVEMNLWSHLE